MNQVEKMNRAIKNYLVLQFISLLIIYTVFNAIYYFNSSVASETITSHIRNDLIIRDFKSVQFNLNFAKNSGFDLVEVFDENMKRILAISEPDQPIWTKIIRKEIYVNPTIKTPQYVLFFYYDLNTIFIFTPNIGRYKYVFLYVLVSFIHTLSNISLLNNE